MERVRNMIKADKRKSRDLVIPNAKRYKSKEDLLLRRYPSAVAELQGQVNKETAEEHCKLMNAEAAKKRPRCSIIRPLMKVTYVTRSLYIQTEANSVKEILETYAALELPSVVSMHFVVDNCVIEYCITDGAGHEFYSQPGKYKRKICKCWRKFVQPSLHMVARQQKSLSSDIYSLSIALVSYNNSFVTDMLLNI